MFKLQDISVSTVGEILSQHSAEGGAPTDESLSKLFSSLGNEENRYEVSIKVAALNNIYSTAIQYIEPVVDKIVEKIGNDHGDLTEEQYAHLVDDISCVSWVTRGTGKTHNRKNLSFCSKYIHFLSKYKLPIYDSYIWIVMTGYRMQQQEKKLSFAAPSSYVDFYAEFNNFKTEFKLSDYSNYQIDKYLWQYGKNLVVGISESTKNRSLDKSKTILKRQLRWESS